MLRVSATHLHQHLVDVWARFTGPIVASRAGSRRNRADRARPPRFASDRRVHRFFPAERIDLAAAKRGKLLFDGNCARCHGQYDKGWQRADESALSLTDKLATTEVRYHEKTPVEEVGTDSLRYLGMSSLVQLNELAISSAIRRLSRNRATCRRAGRIGAFAVLPITRHQLCAVLTRSSERPASTTR